MAGTKQEISDQMMKVASELGKLFAISDGDEYSTSIDLQEIQAELVSEAMRLVEEENN